MDSKWIASDSKEWMDNKEWSLNLTILLSGTVTVFLIQFVVAGIGVVDASIVLAVCHVINSL